MNKENKLPVTDFIAVDRYAGKNNYNIPDYDSEELKKEFKSDILHRAMPSTRMINEILHKMGKTTPEQELNCGSCGYDTCREKAIAVYQNKADFTMCLPFLKDKAESFSDKIIKNTPNGIIVLNEDLIVQQINNAACEIMNIKNSSDILNSPVVRVLNPTEYLNVMDTKRNVHDKKVYLAEYGKYVEETIIYDPDYHMIMSIIQCQKFAMETRRDLLGDETIDEAALTERKEEIERLRKRIEQDETEAQKLEDKLDYLEDYWDELEDDYDRREEAVQWMRQLPKGREGTVAFLNGLTGEHCKAFILSITVYSPLKYSVHWFDDTRTKVEMDSNIEDFRNTASYYDGQVMRDNAYRKRFIK